MNSVPGPDTEQQRIDQAWWFLHQIWGSYSSDTKLVVTTKSGGGLRSTWFTPATIRDAATAIGQTTDCTYMTSAAQITDLGPGSRGGAANCSMLSALWVDIDVGQDQHKTGNPLCATSQDVQSVLNAIGPEPSILVDTGGGYHAWYLLDQPVDTEIGVELLRRWRLHLDEVETITGFQLDRVQDISRIMRVPGSINHKQPDALRPVTVTDHTDSTYSAEFWHQLLPVVENPLTEANANVDFGLDTGPAPGTLFNQQVSCDDVFARNGWTPVATDHEGTTWRRPNKPDRGVSAKTYADPDGEQHATIYSSNAGVECVGLPQSAFSLMAHLEHAGDMSFAAKTLIAQGYDPNVGVVNWLATLGHTAAPTGGLPVAASIPSSTPEPILIELARPDFPLDIYPDWITNIVTGMARTTQTPVDLAALVALGAISGILNQREQQIQVQPGWIGGPNLYLLIGMASGTGKSAVFEQIMEPVNEISGRLYKQSQTRFIDSQAKESVLNNQLQQAEKDNDLQAMRHVRERLAELDLRTPVHMRSDDLTPEAFVAHLEANNGRILIASSEGGLFEGLSRYSKTGTANMDALLKAWSGDQIVIERRHSETIFVPHPRATIIMTAQPDILAGLFSDDKFAARGLASRFMVTMPPNLVGYRIFDQKPIPDQHRQDWAQSVTAIYDKLSAPITWTLTAEARHFYQAWLQANESRFRRGKDLSHLTIEMPKITAGVLSVSLILAAVDKVQPGADGQVWPAGDLMGHTEVTERHVRKGVELADYLIAQLKGLKGLIDATDDEVVAQTLLEWLQQRDPLSIAQIRRDGPRKARNIDQLNECLSILQDRNLVHIDQLNWETRRRGIQTATVTAVKR